MTITLSPELENFVNEKIQSGEYRSPDDAVASGLLRLREDDILFEIDQDELRREIQKGIDCHARGEVTVYTSEELTGYADKVIAETKRRWEAKQAEGGK